MRLAAPALRIVSLATAALASALLAPAAARAVASPWSENPQSRVRLITPYQVAPRHGELRLGIHFRLSPGWHVYWKNSGDAGFPPVVNVTGGPGLGKAELLWPAPRRFDLPGNLVAFGYETEVVYPVRATIDAATGDRLRLSADVDYLTCQIDCVPYRYTLTLEQPLGDTAAADPETAPLVDRYWRELPVAADGLAGVATDGRLDARRAGAPELIVHLRGVQADPRRADLFLEPHPDLEAGRPVASADGDGLTFRVPLKAKQVNRALPATTAFAWTVTGLERDGAPLSLEAKRQVSLVTAAGGPSLPTPGALLRALFAGILLALTPGALALLLGEPTGTLRPTLVRAAFILLASWAVAGLVAASGTRGPIGAGDPRRAALTAAVAVLLALDLWGLLRTDRARAPLVRAALFGLLTALSALAWAVPPLGASLASPAAGGRLATVALFTAVGLGLALPTVVAPLFVRLAPSPAARGALGFLALASAAWPLYRLAHEVSPEGLASIELVLLGLSLFAWLGSRPRAKGALKFIRALGVAALLVAAWWLAERGRLEPGASGALEVPVAGAPGSQPQPSST